MKVRRATNRHRPARGRAALAAACGAALAMTALGWPAPGLAAASGAAASGGGFAEFNRSMLAGGGQAADLARFERGNPVLPGIYNVDVYLNQAWVGRFDVHFASPSPNASAIPCVDQTLMDRMGLQPAKSAVAATTQLKSPDACVTLAELIPGAKLTFDMSNLRLDASVPQAYLGQMPRGYVNPASWDAGVPAFLLNYNLNTWHASNHGLNQTSAYLGLNAGFNLGPWHFRQDSTLTWQSGSAGIPGQRHWQNIDTYVRRDLPKLRATLTVGDSYTDGAVFDSFGIRGVQLTTDDRMLPQSQRGYAPVIHGVAETNAKVSVRQNGVQIYQTTVSPGPFVIDDLYPTGYGGNLEVTVTEADGRVHTFSVPYASVAQLLRPGITRFDVAAGQLRDQTLQDKPDVIEASAQHGFNNLFTGYAGMQGSEGYAAVLVGGAFNTRLGALAVDVTEARTEIPGYGTQSGQSFRITYSKIIPDTNTSLTVAAYRYSTGGFLSLTDAAAARDYARHGLATFQYLPANVPMIDGVPVPSLLTPAQSAALAGTAYTGNPLVARGLEHQRNRFTLTLNQRLGERGGSLYATVSLHDYWNRGGTDTQFQVGYNNHIGRLSYGISANRMHDPLSNRYDNQFFLNASVPLGSSVHAPSLSFNLNHSDTAGSQEQATLNGTAGAWNQFTYGATTSHGSDSTGSAFSVNAGYASPYAVFNASAGTGSGYSQESFAASGALVAHKGGIIFGQPMGDTSAIVYAPGAAGAHITNAPGVTVDRSGYALVPYLTPYQLDTIQIDPRGLSLGVQLDATSANVAPYAGAVVQVDFKTHYGRALIAHIQRPDGSTLPFGTEVRDVQGHAVGVVGQGGLALLRVTGKSGRLDAQWQGSQGAAQACSFAYTVPALSGSPQDQNPINATCTTNGTAAPQHRDAP
ncbi:MAG: fimbria/pilus outer membrane usher protein [Rhodanobacteraceae bacterium]